MLSLGELQVRDDVAQKGHCGSGERCRRRGSGTGKRWTPQALWGGSPGEGQVRVALRDGGADT